MFSAAHDRKASQAYAQGTSNSGLRDRQADARGALRVAF
jgi:hypothetical protein